MSASNPISASVAAMPRGGPHASWLDRMLQTSALEYIDRLDVPDQTKHHVIDALDRMGAKTGTHQRTAQMALECVAGVDEPRILELGAGHGQVSDHILGLHPTARLTITDLDPTSVARVAAGPIGQNPRATTKVVDATAIDEPDHSFDLVVFANSFHHLPPRVAVSAIAEATRVGRTFLITDLKRSHPVPLVARTLLGCLVVIPLVVRPLAAVPATIHDAIISNLRCYSPSAFTALGRAADPEMRTDFLPPINRWISSICVTYRRSTAD